jgi:hypothetical protein
VPFRGFIKMATKSDQRLMSLPSVIHLICVMPSTSARH